MAGPNGLGCILQAVDHVSPKLMEIRKPLILKGLLRDREIPYSHSMINGPSKLLIRKALATVPQPFTVSFTDRVRSTSIGASLHATRAKVTFRDLSMSIDSQNHRRQHRRASMSRSGTRARRAGIKRHRLLSRLTFRQFFTVRGTLQVPFRCVV